MCSSNIFLYVQKRVNLDEKRRKYIENVKKPEVKKMNSEQVRALARVFQQASDSVKDQESKLVQETNEKAATWSGKARDKFDSAMDEAKILFQRHSDNLYDISRELEAAADSVDRVREEIERQEELERMERILRLKKLDVQ